MSRLSGTFAALRGRGETGLVTYVTAGDPNLERSAGVLRALDRAGADVIEVGVPFSDPVADGPVIERATERARAAGGTLSTTIDLVAAVRGEVRAPIVLFSYLNPILAMGEQAFVERAAAAGVDGVLVLDLPIEESVTFQALVRAAGLDLIFLVSPTTTDERLQRAVDLASGFLYVISRLGVTGARATVAEGAESLVERIRSRTALPVALGFGISRPEHVRQVGGWADAAVVGSALVSVIAEAGTSCDLERRVERYVGEMKAAARGRTAARARHAMEPSRPVGGSR